MRYIFDVPCRLEKKKGIFGSLENIDIMAVAMLGIIGFLSAVLMPGLAGLSILGITITISWLCFIQPMKYGDNARIWFMRMTRFKRSQKIYYFYRYR